VLDARFAGVTSKVAEGHLAAGIAPKVATEEIRANVDLGAANRYTCGRVRGDGHSCGPGKPPARPNGFSRELRLLWAKSGREWAAARNYSRTSSRRRFSALSSWL
jgi:hypothetical protein